MTTWKDLNYPDSSIDDWDQATIAEADAYHAARGNTLWTGEDAVKTVALQRAWDYLRGLTWREDVFDTELPADVKSAQIVGALAELVDAGALQPEITRDDYLTKKNIAGVIIKEYASSAPKSKQFKAINALLSRYIVNSNGTRLVRG